MVWSTPISSGDIVAIHAALVPTKNGDGEIILFGGDNHDLAAARTNQFNHSARFNCRHPDQALLPIQSPAFDLFCCGHAFLPDGRLMVAGGTEKFHRNHFLDLLGFFGTSLTPSVFLFKSHATIFLILILDGCLGCLL
jgi:hypothetical protein